MIGSANRKNDIFDLGAMSSAEPRVDCLHGWPRDLREGPSSSKPSAPRSPLFSLLG